MLMCCGLRVAELCRAGGTITAAELVRQIRLVGKNKAFSGLILRVDSPGTADVSSDATCHTMFATIVPKQVLVAQRNGQPGALVRQDSDLYVIA